MPNRQTVYDPNDAARTTIKETTIDNKHTGQAAGPVKLTVYDANDVARTTIKETTIDKSTAARYPIITRNLKMTKYDDEAKRTLRETWMSGITTRALKPSPEKLQTFNRKNPQRKQSRRPRRQPGRFYRWLR